MTTLPKPSEAAEMPVSETRYRRALGQLAGGVALVTSRGPDGEACGLTATSVCSVSLEPPLVLVSIAHDANTHDGITSTEAYAVNLLGADQEELAVRFARPEPGKFRDLEVEERETGAPVLARSLGHLDCTVVRAVPAGDHTVFIGRVEAAEVREDAGPPLVYHLGRYDSLGLPEGP